ncbi:MAG: seg [Parcubacteria group bacterium]|nr:seg [Parcubacteria group bacterium]
MRFQVPQFIEVEDKIFGPFTFKQFIYLAGGAGICAVLFTLLPKFIAILIAVPVAVFALCLAFYKVNEKPFAEVVEAFIAYTLGGKLYIWKKEDRQPTADNREPGQAPAQVYVPKLSQSKLKDLSLALDISPAENSEGKDRI